MMRSRPCSIWRRRALDLSSVRLPEALSSMNRLVRFRLSMTEPMRLNSSSVRVPVFRRWESTWSMPQKRRSTSCSLPISKEKMPTVLLRREMFWARERAREVLPMAGRAARMMSSPGRKPKMMLSRER